MDGEVEDHLIMIDAYDAIHRESDLIPDHFDLHQNYPNPFNPSTIIRYDLAHPGNVDLRIYDVRGALVKIIENRYLEPGRYEIGWDGVNTNGIQVASGIYFYRLEIGDFVQTKKMLLLR